MGLGGLTCIVFRGVYQRAGLFMFIHRSWRVANHPLFIKSLDRWDTAATLRAREVGTLLGALPSLLWSRGEGSRTEPPKLRRRCDDKPTATQCAVVSPFNMQNVQHSRSFRLPLA